MSVTLDDVYIELGAFGMRLTNSPPFRAFENDIQMQFIVEEADMGIVVVSNWDWWCTTEVRERIIQRFWREHNVVVYVLFDIGSSIHMWVLERDDDEFDVLKEQAYERAEELLVEQIQAFIARQSGE